MTDRSANRTGRHRTDGDGGMRDQQVGTRGPARMNVEDVQHGTYAGAQWHGRRNVPICEPCRDAATLYQREWRHRSSRSRSVLVPVELLIRVATAVPEPMRTQVESLIPVAEEDTRRPTRTSATSAEDE